MHIGLDELENFAAGRLSDVDAARIESHLLECAECGLRLDAVDLSSDSLVSLLRNGRKHEAITRVVESSPDQSAADTLPASGSAVRWANLAPGDRFGRYGIRQELGRGGMGVVWRADDPALRRQVALKIIAPHRLARPDDRVRFQREAESAARLQHANIVQIFEFDECAGQLYCAFELVEGGSLAQRLERSVLPPSEAAAVTATLADAVDYAHQRRVIHRDLKPANILFTADGTPKIADFGLAKLLDDVTQTEDGTLLGSPCYMAPEQAEGKLTAVGPPTDIYSLGAILYESLVGRPPFRGASVLATLEHVKHAEPISPSRLLPALDRDLETICLKCLRKTPEQRYRTAADLAADLRRFSAGMPIMAHKATWWQRGAKLARRHPLGTAFSALFAIVLATFLVTVGLYNVWLRQAVAEANDRWEFARRNMYSLQLQRAVSVASLDPEHAQRLLDDPQRCPHDLRDFAWRHLHATCRRELDTWENGPQVFCLAAAPDGRTFATGDAEGNLRLWSSGRPEPVRAMQAHKAAITDVAFSADAALLAAASEDGTVSVWSGSGDELCFRLAADAERANGVAFSPDQKHLATAHSDGVVRVWSLPTGQPVTVLHGHEESVLRVSFNSNGEYLASGSRDETARIWRTETWREHATIADHHGFVHDLRFHPHDPAWLAAATGDRNARFWTITAAGEAQSRNEALRGFEDTISAIAFSGNGARLAVGSYDRTIRVWQAASGELETVLRQQKSGVSSLAFPSPDELLTATRDGRIKRWSIHGQGEPMVIDAHERSITGLAYLGDGETLISASYAGDVRLWSAADGQPVAQWRRAGESVSGITLAADRRQLAWESGGTVYLSRLPHAQRLDPVAMAADPLFPTAIVLSSAGDLLLVADFAGLKMLAVPSGRTFWTWSDDEIRCLAASPVSSTIAAAGTGERVWIADAADGRFRSFPSVSAIRSLAFSADGNLVGVGMATGEAAVHDLATGQILARVTGHAGPVSCLAFSPDGKTVATGGSDGDVQLWDPITGSERVRLTTPRPVHTLVFAPRSDSLAAGGEDGAIRIWKADLPPRP